MLGRAVSDLREGEVYLVTTTDRYSLIGEYAGSERSGRTLVFVPGPLSPIRIPAEKVVEAERLTHVIRKEPVHGR